MTNLYLKPIPVFNSLAQLTAIAVGFSLPLSTTMMHVFLWLTLVFLILGGQWKEKLNYIVQSPLAWISLTFFLLFVVGLTYTTALWSDATHIAGKYTKFLFLLALLPIFKEKKCGDYALNAFLAASMLTLVLGFLKALGWIHFGHNPSPAWLFKDHIQTSFILAFAAYILIHRAWYSPRWRMVCLILWVSTIFFLFFLNTGRSGQVLLLGLMGLFFYQILRWKGVAYTFLAAVILLSLAWSFSGTFRELASQSWKHALNYSQYSDSTSVGLRTTFVLNSIKLWEKHPIIGTGTGSFAHEYKKHICLGDENCRVMSSNPHNEYSFLAVQFGVVGLLFLLGMFFFQLRLARNLPEDQRYLAQALIVGIALGCMSNSWLLDTTEGHFYIYFLALLLGKKLFNRSVKDKIASTFSLKKSLVRGES